MICEAVVLLRVQDLKWHLETITAGVLREKKQLKEEIVSMYNKCLLAGPAKV